jgi:hypothetical protein
MFLCLKEGFSAFVFVSADLATIRRDRSAPKVWEADMAMQLSRGRHETSTVSLQLMDEDDSSSIFRHVPRFRMEVDLLFIG